MMRGGDTAGHAGSGGAVGTGAGGDLGGGGRAVGTGGFNLGGASGDGGTPGTSATGGRAGEVGGASGATGTGGSTGGTSGTPGTGGRTGGMTGMGGGDSGRYVQVAPNGTGTACTSAEPCSITQAQMVVRALPTAMRADAIVELADGTYALQAPLIFDARDSGSSGHPVVWQAASGARPIVSGGRTISGWTISDAAKNIWKASAPGAFAARQLFVDGKIATRARQSINRSDMSTTSTQFRFTNNAIINTITHPERADVHAVGSFTDRYSPIQSIANGAATMVLPGWANNIWGWDTLQSPFRAGPVYIENAYELLDQPGEWYLDTTSGVLYYKPQSGQDMTTVDVELPQLDLLVAVGGTLDAPAHDITFKSLSFSYTSWLGPNSSDGYACQQSNAFIHGSGYPIFEASRPKWWQMPAAVQVSSAKNITFLRNRFVALGQVGLGIGNDDNAHKTGVGLATDTINVTGNLFAQIAAGAIVLGGIQANAHHPCGDKVCTASDAGTRSINRNSTISNNYIHDVGIDYRDSAGILFTYTSNVTVSHNEIFNIPYSGINVGFGWGANDAGGSPEYETRGLYTYQLKYVTATVAQGNRVQANNLHDVMREMNDGGCFYNLSANPMTVLSDNSCKGACNSNAPTCFAVYLDEGSRYLTITKNVFTAWGSWANANAGASNYTGDLTLTNNWVTGGVVRLSNGTRNNVVTGNISLSGSTLPSDAQSVANGAGLESAYADLKTRP